MRGDCSIRISGLGFTPDEIVACVARKGLLSIELDLAVHQCGCAACADEPQPPLSLDEIRQLLGRARAEGAKRCILIDSEPTTHPDLRELIDSAHSFAMEVEVFISAAALDPAIARFLRQRQTTVVTRFDFSADRFPQAAITHLKEAGYSCASAPPLAVAIEVTEQNLPEIPAIWRWARNEKIDPRVQIITPRGKDRKTPRVVSPNRSKALFEQLARIDLNEFHRDWELPPSLTGRSCNRHLFACHVTPCGNIFACVGVTIPLGNVRKEPLREILELSEVLENLRAYQEKVKDPCRTCCQSTDCYGCRGAAYQLTGDYLSGDSMCWKADGIDVESLPVGVAGLVPHGKSMRMIDQIVQIGERESRVTFPITRECILVDSSGRLDDLAYVEMIAQSFAATHGFHLSPENRRNHRGLLLGAKDLQVSGEARIGDLLTVRLKKVTRFGAFGVVEGAIYRQDGSLIATGQIKIWRPSDSELEAVAL